MDNGINDEDGCVGGGRGIDDASKVLETTTGAARIWGQRQRLRRRDDRPEELATTTKSLEDEYDPKVSTTTTDASAEEAEETTRLRERP